MSTFADVRGLWRTIFIFLVLLEIFLREIDVSQFSVRYEYLLLACPAKARR